MRLTKSVVFIAIVALLAAIVLSGCGGGLSSVIPGLYPYMGSYSGTYSGSETGKWSAVVDETGTATVVMESPSLGALTGSNSIDANGHVTVQTNSLTGVHVTWSGSFVKTTNGTVFAGGSWQSTNGKQGAFCAATSKADLSTVAEASASDGTLFVASPEVAIKWNSSDLSGLTVQEYHIWRSDCATPILVVQNTSTTAVDDLKQKTISYSCVNAALSGISSKSSSVPAAELGKAYTYSVSALCSKRIDGNLRFFETPLSASGQAMPLALMTASNLKAPTMNSHQNLASVAFQWLSVKGADKYIVEASTSSTFTNPEFVSDPVSVTTTTAGQTLTLTATTLEGIFGSLSSTDRIYWRVGAKHSADVPGPKEVRTGARYIYSPSATFFPQ